MKKKLISLLLVVTICLSLGTVAFADGNANILSPAETMQGF